MKTNILHDIKFLLCLLITSVGLSANADSITYTHEGSTLEYSTSSTTCSVSRWISGANVVIPETVTYQGVDYQVTYIITNAFKGYSGITSITIPNTVTFINSETFRDCKDLTTITIPNSVSNISSYAFYNCSSLISVSIPNSVTTIGSSAFDGCSSLTSVTLPSTLTKIERYLFTFCSSLKSITIPNAVTSIEYGAFYKCSSLTSVVIPPLVTSIGGIAFDGCTGLKKSAYPYRLSNPFPTGICVGYNPSGAVSEDGVIYGSSKSSILFAPITLEGDFIVPSSVTTIGAKAFNGCNGLTSVIIPPSVTTIGASAFDGCTGLRKSAYPSTIKNPFPSGFCLAYNPNGAVIENGVVYGPSKSSILFAPANVEGDFVIPNSVTTIEANAFSGCSGLTSVTLPSSMATIGHYAFSGCSGIQSVVSQASRAPSIYKDSFEELFNRATLFIPRNSLNSYLVSNWMLFSAVKYADGDISMDIYSDGALSYYLMMDANETGENTAVVKQGSNEGLTSVVIPESIADENSNNYYVTGICNNAFNGCTGLKSVEIPSSVTSIGENAFKNCSGLTAVFIPSSVTFIGDGAFEGCTGLRKSAYPSSINNPFSNEVSIGYDSETSVIEDGVIYGQGKSSILYAPLTLNGQFDIPSSVTTIGRHAFDGCSGLTSVVIPNSVEEIGQSAFADCSSLSSVTLNSTIKSIADNTFANCRLTEVVLPPAVETIGSSAFAGNSGLNKIVMGCNVKTIRENAFLGANADAVFITAKNPPVAPVSTFSSYAGKLYVQGEAAVGAYQDAATCWDRFEVSRMSEPKMMIYQKPDGVNGLPGEQFTLKVTVIPASVDLPYLFWRSTNPAKAYVDGQGLVTVLQEITPDDNVEIIAETLYCNGPTAKFEIGQDASGVEEVVIGTLDESAPVDVYNLQGVKVLSGASVDAVSALSPGLYIVRQGSRTTKIAVR